MSSIEVRQKSPMEEADSGESGPHRGPEHLEGHAQRNRGSPGSREGSLPAGAKLTEEEQAKPAGSESPRDVQAGAPSASINKAKVSLASTK